MTWFYKKKMKKELSTSYSLLIYHSRLTQFFFTNRKEIMKKETSQMEPPPKGK